MQRTKTNKILIFEPGKYYKHNGGGMLHCIHYLQTFMYGITLIAEDRFGRLHPVGMDTTSAVNYEEITKEEYEK